jgi:hypothetical protein
MRTKTALSAAAFGLLATLALTGCGAHASAPDVAPAGIQQGTHQHAIQEPYGFRNVAFSCFGLNGVYVTSAGAGDTLPSSVAVVPNDPQCKG